MALAYMSTTTASEYVYQQIRKSIFEKRLQSGQRLPEIALAKEFDVSRTPVREALRKLESEGLVQIVPGWGACLASPTRQEIIDTYEVREDLEVLAVRKAARHITPLQLCRLQEQIDAERKTFEEHNLEAYLDVNDAFHQIIAESSGNSALASIMKNILARAYVQSIFFESFFDFDTNPSLDEHIEIHQALRERNVEKSVELMRKHIHATMDSLKAK